MEAPIKQVRISKTAKEKLIKLKRITKIDNWNILCRWALCRSLAEPTIPSPVPIKTADGVEMTWDIFGGEIANILLIALKQRCHQDSLGTENTILKEQLALHLHRGIDYLAGDSNLENIEDLISLAFDR
ncbi:MAG: DNA sulfur modification protein DndE [Xenococcus sp. MO_188.B8]|nr:DNA sulfur modification protein DndE [Xenococcus sp. MO_188.B8]